MKEIINKILCKIKKDFIDNFKFIAFLTIFCLLVFVYNQNSQTLNYILNRGTILEYSIGANINNDLDNATIKKAIENFGIKYYSIESFDETNLDNFDYENKKINKRLKVVLPIMPKLGQEQLFNNVSDVVFKQYQNAKLIEVKALNNSYNEPYLSLLKFLGVLFVTSIIWIIFLYLIYDSKTLNQKIKNEVIRYFENQKQNWNNIKQKTKERGYSYLITRILFTEKDEEETNVTKEVVTTIIFVLVCVILIRYFVGELRWIPSGSMHPTILEKDRVFVEKLEFPHKEIKRGDILVFYPPETELSYTPLAIFSRLSGIFCRDIAYIKRTIGLPGEKFEIKYDNNNNEYRVFINDIPLNEPYITSKSLWTECSAHLFCGPFVIPENSYFMMGDNRNNSQDSRFWGFLEENRIIGRANFMFWPIKRINILRDKYLKLYKNANHETNDYIVNRYEE